MWVATTAEVAAVKAQVRMSTVTERCSDAADWQDLGPTVHIHVLVSSGSRLCVYTCACINKG